MSVIQRLKTCPADELINIIKRSSSKKEVLYAFGCKHGTDAVSVSFLNQFIQDNNVSLEHFSSKTKLYPKRWKYTLEQFQSAVKSHQTWNKVMLSLGLRPTGSMQQSLERKVRLLNMDISHFKREVPTTLRKWTVDNIFVENSGVNSSTLRHHARKHIPNQCKCGITNVWEGSPIQLELDHVNGNCKDNRICNLRFLCPNCHSQTDTHRGKNNKKHL